jgi:N-acetylglucosamine-6-phosphate deacetylase
MILVTDAIAATGIGDGTYRLGSLVVTVTDMTARREDGGLGGSVLTMDRAVRNLLAITGCTLEQAITAASGRPADLMGLADRGTLTTGRRADIVLLDRDAAVAATITAGRVAYVADPDRILEETP